MKAALSVGGVWHRLSPGEGPYALLLEVVRPDGTVQESHRLGPGPQGFSCSCPEYRQGKGPGRDPSCRHSREAAELLGRMTRASFAPADAPAWVKAVSGKLRNYLVSEGVEYQVAHFEHFLLKCCEALVGSSGREDADGQHET